MIPLLAGFLLGRFMSSILSMVLGAVIVYVALAHLPVLTHMQIPTITPKINVNVSQ